MLLRTKRNALCASLEASDNSILRAPGFCRGVRGTRSLLVGDGMVMSGLSTAIPIFISANAVSEVLAAARRLRWAATTRPGGRFLDGPLPIRSRPRLRATRGFTYPDIAKLLSSSTALSFLMQIMQMFVRILIFLAITAGIVACLYFLGSGDLKGHESALLSIVLTGLSVLASWVLTDMYAANQHKAAIEEVQEAHRTNLRTYALKAAEKVTNLSNELSRLSTFLQQELDCTEYRNSEEELQAKEERLESAIHIINTLKSVNDTSLSDWQGVIGEELEEQREEKHERQQAALEQIEAMLAAQLSDVHTGQQTTQEMRAEIESVRRDLRAIVTVSGITAPLPRVSRSRQVIESHCPSCGAILKYKQKPTPRSIKGTRCIECQTRLVARYDDQRGHYLVLRTPVRERIDCPNCGMFCDAELDPVPGSSAGCICAKCKFALKLVRTADTIRVHPATTPFSLPQPELTEGMIERIRAKLPAQPWPTGIHRAIASDLCVPPHLVNQAIDVLIGRGVFLPQADGKVLDPGPRLSAAARDAET